MFLVSLHDDKIVNNSFWNLCVRVCVFASRVRAKLKFERKKKKSYKHENYCVLSQNLPCRSVRTIFWS